MRRTFDGILVLGLLLASARLPPPRPSGKSPGRSPTRAAPFSSARRRHEHADQRGARSGDELAPAVMCFPTCCPASTTSESTAGLSEQSHQRGRAAGAADGPARFLPGAWLGGGGGRGDRQRADDQHHGRHGRDGHRQQTDPRAAAQRPQLHQPGVAQPERELGLRRRQRRRRQRQAGGRPRDPEFFDCRPAPRIQPLHARRHRQSGRELQHVRVPALDRQSSRNSRCRPACTRPNSGARPRR